MAPARHLILQVVSYILHGFIAINLWEIAWVKFSHNPLQCLENNLTALDTIAFPNHNFKIALDLNFQISTYSVVVLYTLCEPNPIFTP